MLISKYKEVATDLPNPNKKYFFLIKKERHLLTFSIASDPACFEAIASNMKPLLTDLFVDQSDPGGKINLI